MAGTVSPGYVSRPVHLPQGLYERAREAAAAGGWSYARWCGIVLQGAAIQPEDDTLADRLDKIQEPRGRTLGMIKTRALLRVADWMVLQGMARRLGCSEDTLMREIVTEFLERWSDGEAAMWLEALERSRTPVREDVPWL